MRAHKSSWKIAIRCGLLLILIGLIIGGGIWWYENQPRQRMMQHGYPKDEAELILGRVDDADIETILEFDYSSRLIEMVQHEEFQTNRLQSYLEITSTPFYDMLIDKNGKFTLEEIMLVANASQEGLELGLILLEDYYIPERLERYYNFLLENQTASPAETVQLVNANRDREYYSEPEPAETAGHLILVNKYYYLEPDFQVDLAVMPASYGAVGVQMERDTYAAFQKMYDAALSDGYQLYVTSGYRGYVEQEQVYQDWVRQVGEEDAKNYAALPGFSEHQTGQALDIFVAGQTTQSFANHPAEKWLAENAYKYGFILRYAEETENLTGYDYEAWHYRYVGVEVATKIRELRLTLEEYVAYFET